MRSVKSCVSKGVKVFVL